MKELHQTDLTQESGNCLQTCVAMLLDMPIEAVPNFNQGDNHTIGRLENWLLHYGMGLVSFKPGEFQGTLNAYGFAGVKSKMYARGLHAVIWRMDRKGEMVQIYWDPNPGHKFRYGSIYDHYEVVRLYMIVPHPTLYPVLTVEQVLDPAPADSIWRCPVEDCRKYLPIDCDRKDCPRKEAVDPFEEEDNDPFD